MIFYNRIEDQIIEISISARSNTGSAVIDAVRVVSEHRDIMTISDDCILALLLELDEQVENGDMTLLELEDTHPDCASVSPQVDWDEIFKSCS